MPQPLIEVRDLDLGYGDVPVLTGLNFCVNKGDIFIVMGMSGCGKSTLLKSFIGLLSPMKGKVFFEGRSFWDESEEEQENLMRRVGVLYQSGALWSSFTIGENVSLPLKLYSKLSKKEIEEKVKLKLALVGLEEFKDYMPSELSGGMQKRAALARAIALDPHIIFFDEPSAGLDPVNAKMLDDLILKIGDHLNTTIIVVTHELASIFAIGNNSVFLDAESKTMIATGNPNDLLINSRDQKVLEFLTRGKNEQKTK